MIQKNESGANSDTKWVVTCSAITFAFSLLIVLSHMSSVLGSILLGNKIEGLIVFLLTGFWAATVAIVTKTTGGNSGENILNSSVLVRAYLPSFL